MLWRKWHHCSQLITLSLVVLAICAASQAADVPQGVVLIGWDGAQRNHVKEMLAADELPALAALAKDGTMVDIDVTTDATETAPGWSQILTGYFADKTGIKNDRIYQTIPEGYTIFERLKDFYGPENIKTTAIISKTNYYLGADKPFKIPYGEWRKIQEQLKKIDDNKPGPNELQGGIIVRENRNIFVQMPGGPYLNAKKHLELFVNGLMLNEKVAAQAMDQLEQYKGKRFFIFVHFIQPDKAGHKYGENSQEYSNGIESDDLWSGKIIDKLKDLEIYDKTLVYIAVDHGFDEDKTSHSYAPFIFLATNDKKVNRNGTREDIAPTILKRFGMDVTKIEPRLDGFPLDEPAPERKAPVNNPIPAKAAIAESQADAAAATAK
jgi:hypothetical protein